MPKGKPVPDAETPATRVGQLIVDRMQENGVSIKDLAEKLDITYEHTRRVVRGEGIPSKYVLKLICEALGIPFKEARKKTTWTPAMKKAAGERMKARWKAKLTAASKPTKRSKKTAATPKQESEGQI